MKSNEKTNCQKLIKSSAQKGERDMKKRKVIAVLTAAVMVIGLMAGAAGCGNGQSKNSGSAAAETGSSKDAKTSDGDLTTVRAAVMTNNLDQWIDLVGVEKGFFEENGIDLKLTEFAAGVNTVDAIVTGQADIGMLADYALVNRIGNTQDSSQLQIVARFGSGTGSDLYVNPDKVTKLEDLKGQGVLTLPGTVWDYWNAVAFEKAGVAEKDQNIIKVESAQAALGVMTSGQAVAFWAGGLNGSKLQEAGMKELVSGKELGIRTDQYYISSADYLKQNSSTVEQYLKAVKETQEWMQNNPEEAAEILSEKQNVAKEQFLTDFENYTYTIDFTQEALDHLNDIKAWAVKSGKFDSDYDILDHADLSAVKALYPDQVTVQ